MFDYNFDKCVILIEVGVWHRMEEAEKHDLLLCTTKIQADNKTQSLISKYL